MLLFDYFILFSDTYLLIAAINTNKTNSARLNITIVALTGISAHTKEVTRPPVTQNTETSTEVITTEKKRLHKRIDVSAGKIIRAEISNVPRSRIPITIVTAVSI